LENVCTSSAVKIVSCAAEKMQPWRCWKRSVGKDRPWPKRALITETSLITRRGEESHASADHLIDYLRDSAVLEHRLGNIEDVIDEDFRSRRGKGLNIGRVGSNSI
jgi:hypothetical protein